MDKVTSIGSPQRRRRAPVPAKGHSPKGTRRKSTKEASSEKADLAWQLRLAGKLPSEIAPMIGLEDPHDVYQLIYQRFAYDSSFLTEQERKSVLAMELARLDALQAAIWPAAMMGDPKSVDTAIRLISTRAKITGLEAVDPVVSKNLVLVMGEKEEDYIAALKASGTPVAGE